MPDPHIELYNPANMLIASGVTLGDGRNEAITFTVPVAGTYRIRVTSQNSTTGEYLLASASCMLSCPSNITVPNDPNQCGAVVNYPAPTTTGSCGTITCTAPSGSFFPVGTTTVTCTAQAGSSCSFTVKVNDTQGPTITCPGSITKFTDSGQLTAIVNPGVPVALDNCSVSITGVRSDGKPLNAPYPVGVTMIIWTVTDTGGNTASCGQSIAIMVPSGTRRRRP